MVWIDMPRTPSESASVISKELEIWQRDLQSGKAQDGTIDRQSAGDINDNRATEIPKVFGLEEREAEGDVGRLLSGEAGGGIECQASTPDDKADKAECQGPCFDSGLDLEPLLEEVVSILYDAGPSEEEEEEEDDGYYDEEEEEEEEEECYCPPCGSGEDDATIFLQEDVRVIIPSFDDLTLSDPSPPSPPGGPRCHSPNDGVAGSFDLPPLGAGAGAGSRGILASCRVPGSFGGVPDVLREIRRRSQARRNLPKDTYFNNFPVRSALARGPSLRQRSWRVASGDAPSSSSPSSRSLELTCEGPKSGPEGAPGGSSSEGEAMGPQFFADLCSLWPDLIVRLAHDISLESPSVEDAPDPPDPPGGERGTVRRRDSSSSSSSSFQVVPLASTTTCRRATSSGKCCSDDDPCCPQLLVEQTQELRAAGSACCSSPKRQKLGPCLSAGIQPTSCPSPICGSPAPRRPRPASSEPSSVESSGDADVSTFEYLGGEELLPEEEDDEDEDEDPSGDGGGVATTPPEGDLEEEEGGASARPSVPWDSMPSERKRRKLPQIPKDKKCEYAEEVGT